LVTCFEALKGILSVSPVLKVLTWGGLKIPDEKLIEFSGKIEMYLFADDGMIFLEPKFYNF
jgi:hypothetical protein